MKSRVSNVRVINSNKTSIKSNPINNSSKSASPNNSESR